MRAPSSVAAGKVLLIAHNVGGAEHEMVVIRGTKEGLPTKADGSVNEKAIESRIVGEIEKVRAQTDKSEEFILPEGTYTLMCNADSTLSGAKVNHYAKGMVTELSVT